MRLPSITALMVCVAVTSCRDEAPPFVERPVPDDGFGAQDRESADGQPMRGLRWEQTFDAHRLQDAGLSVDVPNEMVHESLTLRHIFTDKSKTMQQINRAAGQDGFRQGFPDGTQDEAFTQTSNKNLDILLVVDNSGSMEEEQKNLAARLAPLLSAVEESDWRIAVTTTDPASPCVRAVINKDSPSAETDFRRAVEAGTSGSGNERGVLTAVKALSEGCQKFEGWVRADSSLAVLLLSDEDNCSDGGDCRNEPYADARYLLDHLATIRVPGKNARVYGILWHPSESKSSCPTAAQPANIYAQLIDQTGGSWGSICDEDYTPTLTAISKDMAINLSTKFTLHQAPAPGSVFVTVDGVNRTDFIVVGNVIEFKDAPRDGSQVRVSYSYQGQPIKSAFTLSRAVAPDSVMVTVNGVDVPPQDYALDATHTRLVFASLPPARAVIKVRYREDTALLTTFTLEKGFKSGDVIVRVDGRIVTNVVTDSLVGTVRFPVPPTDGARIQVAFKIPERPLTRYAVAMPDYVEDTMAARDANTGAELDVRFENGHVVFPTESVVEGRLVTLSYANPHRDQFHFTLPSAPVAGSLEVSDGVVTCRDALVLEGTQLYAGHCGFAWDVAEVDVRFQFVAQEYDLFTVRVPDLKADAPQSWSVYVQDKPFAGFQREENAIRLTRVVPVGSRVTVRVDY